MFPVFSGLYNYLNRRKTGQFKATKEILQCYSIITVLQNTINLFHISGKW